MTKPLQYYLTTIPYLLEKGEVKKYEFMGHVQSFSTYGFEMFLQPYYVQKEGFLGFYSTGKMYLNIPEYLVLDIKLIPAEMFLLELMSHYAKTYMGFEMVIFKLRNENLLPGEVFDESKLPLEMRPFKKSIEALEALHDDNYGPADARGIHKSYPEKLMSYGAKIIDNITSRKKKKEVKEPIENNYPFKNEKAVRNIQKAFRFPYEVKK
jgi:hypothetical protein